MPSLIETCRNIWPDSIPAEDYEFLEEVAKRVFASAAPAPRRAPRVTLSPAPEPAAAAPVAEVQHLEPQLPSTGGRPRSPETLQVQQMLSKEALSREEVAERLGGKFAKNPHLVYPLIHRVGAKPTDDKAPDGGVRYAVRPPAYTAG